MPNRDSDPRGPGDAGGESHERDQADSRTMGGAPQTPGPARIPPAWMRDENPRQGFGGLRQEPHPAEAWHPDEWRHARDSWRASPGTRDALAIRQTEGEQWRGRFFGRGPKGYRRSDERIHEEISDRLMMHPDVDASDIEVRVSDGVVTLSGMVDDRHQKRVAEFIAEDAIGVDDVNNQLKVRHGFWTSLAGATSPEREVHRPADRESPAP